MHRHSPRGIRESGAGEWLKVGRTNRVIGVEQCGRTGPMGIKGGKNILGKVRKW